MKYVESGSDYSHSVGYEYDTVNNLTKLVETINGVKHTTTYTYDEDNRLKRTVGDNITQTYTYDAWSRMCESDAWYSGTGGVTKSYFYTAPSSGHTSSQVYNYQADTPEFVVNFDLAYDDNGNITSVEYGTTCLSYAYDSANQLIRENNSLLGKTWVWAYDNAGNILSRAEYAYTTGALGNPLDTVLYTYGDASWGDLLTAYDGQSITYDAIGNPLTDGTWTYTWQHGRELASMSDGETTWTYTYDANGMRTSRTDGTTTYSYIYNGGKLIHMTRGTDTLEFYYDALGVPVIVKYNGEVYNYVTTLQGDVMLILDTDGEIVVEYAYDAWGGHVTVGGTMANTLGTLNPLTYRGYVYDAETGLYYVSSRYYDPEIGRWINADGYVSTGQGVLGNNMFAYCGNNPVNRKDPTGQFWITALIVTAVVAVCTVALSGCSAKPDPAPLPYKTADEAAMAFANSTYSSSSYIRHEYGTVIYSSTTNGTTTYDFATPVAGSPHSVGYGNVKIPSGTTKVATAHTHPNSNNFSGLTPGATSGDIPNAIRRGLDSYVIGPNLNLQKYSISSGTVSVVGVASPVALTSQQQAALVSQFQISWDNHLGTCAFGCEHMTWPTP